MIETLEDRTLLSATGSHALHTAFKHATKVHAATVKPAKVTHTKAAKSSKYHKASATPNLIASSAASSTSTTASTGTTTSVPIFGDFGHVLRTIPFSEAPAAVQNGLTTLAATDHLTAPTATDTVHLGNHSGVETYSLLITSTGTQTDITVDQNGNPVTQPTLSTTTFGTLSGTGTGSDAAVAAEITAIASALGLAAPASTDTVNVSTTAGGAVTYSIHLTRSTSSTSTTSEDGFFEHFGETITVDASGNPVGAQEVPFSVMPTKIQNGINAHLPTGATALATTSTQSVRVLTIDGTTYYSTTFDTSGTQTTVTVDAAGDLATLPSSSTADFSTIPAAAQTELQTLATANGVSGTISGTQTVNVFNEGNGTTIYSVSLSATDSTTSQTYMLTISVDQAGNPTVPPQNFGSGPGDCGGGFAGGGFGGLFGFGDGDGLGRGDGFGGHG